jgi:polar amino acid transport system ATP-binding protein
VITAAGGPAQEDALISVRGLVKRYRSVIALDHVDLDIRAGEIVVVIGPSGSGKSTLIWCLNGLEEIDHGTIRFEGHEIPLNARPQWVKARQRIGMVFQDYTLFPHVTVLRNITLAPVHTGRATLAEAEATAHRLLRRVGLDGYATAYPAELSGGQQQRVAIVRALAMSPDVLLFDEPTSALDPEMIKEVLDVIRKLSADGMTLGIVTHEMNFAREVAHRIIFMDHGRIVESGPPGELLSNPKEPRLKEFLAKIL